MPATRTRRKRQTQHKPVAQRLLDGLPIEKTAANREELNEIKYFAWRDHYPDVALGKKLEGLAYGELERWHRETN
jgi:hypothetical protein